MSDDRLAGGENRETATIHSIAEGRKDLPVPVAFVVPRHEDGSLKLTINTQYRPEGTGVSRALPCLEGDPKRLDPADLERFEKDLQRIKRRYLNHPLRGCPVRTTWREGLLLDRGISRAGLMRVWSARLPYQHLTIAQYAPYISTMRDQPRYLYSIRAIPYDLPERDIFRGGAPTLPEAQRRVEAIVLATFGRNGEQAPLNPVNDVRGILFERALQRMRARALHFRPQRREMAALAWVFRGEDAVNGEVRSAVAVYGDYEVRVVELYDNEAYFYIPESSTIHGSMSLANPAGGVLDLIRELPAPTFEEALLRMEILLRLECGGEVPPELLPQDLP
ncbi:MAG: hypothetical protein PHT60_14850 [Acidiphilium sp.]|nr:hypothetical protein [Acidiphilium sp.]MDD4937040.1 hypothetical protein [Acidiphilium sp.]